MDTRQFRYIKTIAECGSVSRAAEKLFISQSGLNQQLVRIEKELGITIFERDTHNLKITDAGQVVLDHAKEAIFLEERMRAQISDVLDDTVGEIRLNLAMEQGTTLFSSVFPVFHERYPRIRFRLDDQKVYDQYAMLHKKKLDIGMVFISKREVKEFEYIHITSERFLLGIPAGHPLSRFYLPTEGGDYPEMDLSVCKGEPFSLMFAGSTMRQVIDPCFEAAGFVPDIMFESRMNKITALLVSSGICLTILPESQARIYRENIRWFRLTCNPSWESCFIYHKDNPPRKAARYFIQLGVEMGKEMEKKSAPEW